MPDARTLHTACEAAPGHDKWISQLWQGAVQSTANVLINRLLGNHALVRAV